jgi:hypothetical protein
MARQRDAKTTGRATRTDAAESNDRGAKRARAQPAETSAFAACFYYKKAQETCQKCDGPTRHAHTTMCDARLGIGAASEDYGGTIPEHPFLHEAVLESQERNRMMDCQSRQLRFV